MEPKYYAEVKAFMEGMRELVAGRYENPGSIVTAYALICIAEQLAGIHDALIRLRMAISSR